MPNKIPIENKLLGTGKKSGDTSNHAQGAGKGGKVKGIDTFSAEKIATLPVSFDLNNALDKAYVKVVHYMNNMLDPKDLEVEMSTADSIEVGYVTDKLTGEQVSSYDGKEMLRLYAHNHQAKGIIVDGKI